MICPTDRMLFVFPKADPTIHRVTFPTVLIEYRHLILISQGTISLYQAKKLPAVQVKPRFRFSVCIGKRGRNRYK